MGKRMIEIKFVSYCTTEVDDTLTHQDIIDVIKKRSELRRIEQQLDCEFEVGEHSVELEDGDIQILQFDEIDEDWKDF